jgi:5-oxoprolinase (ATP-hydrolysing) subunit A
MRIDLNADAGESFGAYIIGDDANLMPVITSVNLACGFHAGDPIVMRTSVKLAMQHGLGIGAHVGYPDRVGFGRRVIHASPNEVYADTLYQIGALRAFIRAASGDERGGRMQHVKPHGALYNHMANHEPTARAVARAVHDFSETLPVVVLAGSACVEWVKSEGAPVIEELFADRGYAPDGTLLPRSSPGALLTDPDLVAARVVKMVLEGKVPTQGGEITVHGQTVCFHGDTPGAANIARAARRALEAAGVEIKAMRAKD